MLHNIKIVAGLDTKQAKQGRYISVVLAAGEITIRIQLSDDTVMQTELVSGMSFPVPIGFKSVSFSSPVTQQTKIWLGNLPLNYTPLELKTVGSSGLEQSSKNVFFGQVTELVPPKIGRGKVTVQANKEFNIGGVGSTLNNTITIPIGEKFSLSTQSPVYAHSLDKDDIPIEISKFTLPMESNRHSGNLDTITDVYFNHVLGELLAYRSFGIGFYRLEQDLSAFIGDTPNRAGFTLMRGTGKIVGDTLEVFGSKSGTFIKRVISLVDYSVTDKKLSGAYTIQEANIFDLVGSEFLVATGPNGGDELYRGNLTDGITLQITLSTLPFANKVVRNVFINKDGNVAVNTYGGTAVTDDNGATWTSNAAIFENGVIMAHDYDLGIIYGQKGSDIAFSVDGGNSYDGLISPPPAGDTPKDINSIVSNGGFLVAMSADGVMYYDKLNKEWHTFNTRAIIGGSMTPVQFAVSNNGKMYLTTQNNKSIIEFAGEIDVIGGLSVSIMSEIN